jgi:hypothetical protein
VNAWAVRLGGNPRLTALFLDVTFRAFPDEWCMRAFGVPYPPLSVVFGNGSQERYQEMIRRPGSYVKRD